MGALVLVLVELVVEILMNLGGNCMFGEEHGVRYALSSPISDQFQWQRFVFNGRQCHEWKHLVNSINMHQNLSILDGYLGR